MAKATPPAKTGLHVVVERADLLRALTATTRAVEARNTYPILANILLTATEDRLSVRGTDLDVEITTSCPAKCVPGATTVPAKTLLEIVRKFPDGAEVTMVLEGDAADAKLIVKAGRSRFQLSVLDPASFPDISTGDFWPPFEVDLAALFAPVAFAISTEETRYYLNGIFVHNPGSGIRAVATDGHRLARHDGPPVGAGCIVAGVIVPRKAVALIPAGAVKVELSDRKLRVTAGDTVLVSKLIEGTFPDYDRVTPKNNGLLLTADRAQLLSAIDRVSIIASDRGGKGVKVSASPGSLELSVTNPDHGTATEDVPVEAEHTFSIGYNAGYLAEMLRTVTGPNVNFAWKDDGSPSVITGDNDNWLAVLMPMRVS
jgi:DNA polymerase-3 subunit beta